MRSSSRWTSPSAEPPDRAGSARAHARADAPVAAGRPAKPAPFPRRAVLQELEPRLLLSADLNPAAHDTLLATPALQGAEFRALADAAAPTVVTSAQVAPLQRAHEIVFVDTQTPEYATLVEAMREAAAGNGIKLEFVLIDAGRDGIRRITDALAHKSGLDAIHVVSHASDGAVQLGSTRLDFETLVKRAAAIKKWGEALSENGDILFYGCDLAASGDGRSLMQAVARLTGADVAASEDPTGAAAKGGDWDLEFRTGAVEAQVAVGAAAQAQWGGLLVRDVSVGAGGTTTEAGGTHTISVVLTGLAGEAPTSDVVIPISVTDTTEGTVSTTTLTFTPGNWNVAQTVTLTGRDDSQPDGDVGYTFVTGLLASADLTWNGINPADRAMTNADDDRVQSNAVALYTFELNGGATIDDVAGANLALTINDTGNVTWSPGALAVNTNSGADPTIAQSAAGTNEVYTRIVAAQQFTVEAWVENAAGLQQEPSPPHRLVTNSLDPTNRNFSLLMTDADESGGSLGNASAYNARVRGGAGDLNGSNNVVAAPANSATSALQHVALTVDAAGNRTLYVDGVSQGTVNAGAVDYASWANNYRLALFNELTLDRGWVGTMHMAAIYDRALTGAEVQRNFAAGADIHTLVVDTTSDVSDGDVSSIEALLNDRGADGFISLREAILATNATPNAGGSPDRILFNVAGAGPHTISVGAALPAITEAVIIDGWSEPDFAGAPVIELRPTVSGAEMDGLTITGGGSTVRGLVINRFGTNNPDPDTTGAAIVLSGGGGNTIVGNWLGLGTNGTTDRGNEFGIYIDGSANNVIGGATAAERNVIGGNDDEGIRVNGGAATGNRIIGNYIGTDISGTLDRGATSDGILIRGSADGNTVGGTAAGEGNLIAFNDYGVSVFGANSDGNAILGNRIHSSSALGIELDPPVGPDINDPDDTDAGPNEGQNYPVLLSAAADGSTVRVRGSLDGPLNSFFRIEFFANPVNDREGPRYLGYTNIATGGTSANPTFDVSLSAAVAAGEYVTATATRANSTYTAYFDTSEFSATQLVAAAVGSTISGTLWEDVDGDADVSLADGTQRVAGATVHLWSDVFGAPTYVTSATTDANGNYSFIALANGVYGVVVDSKTIAPAAGFNPTFGQSDVWADQTYATAGGARWDGAAITYLAAPGALYGGTELPAGGLSDDASAPASFEHVTRIDATAGGTFTGVDFGFSFSAVTNTRGDDADDDTTRAGVQQQGTLRQFLRNSNAIAGVQSSEFQIGAVGSIQTITPAGAALPNITDAVNLNAWTQGAAGYSGPPLVVLDGNNLGATGLTLGATADGSTIRGFVVRDFNADAIRIQAGSTGNTIAGNYIGQLNPDGTAAVAGEGNGSGIYVLGSGNTIGGTAAADRNVVSGNSGIGIEIDGAAATANVASGNYIGVAADGATALGNGNNGVRLGNGAANNTIGGTAAGAGNLAANNQWGGIYLLNSAGTGNRMLGNVAYSNPGEAGLGLQGFGGNDGQLTAGPNLYMDTPVITAASLAGTMLTVSGYIGTAAGDTDFANSRVELFIADASGDGRVYLGFLPSNVANGNFSGTIDVTGSGLAAGNRLVGTATDPAGNSSEYGAVFVLPTTISGTVYHDVNGNANVGDDGGAVFAGATVRLYADNGAVGTIEAGDGWVGTAITDASGNYSFNVGNGNYWVAVDSTTLNSGAAYNAGYDATWIWAEQTYGDDSTTGGAVDLGARYGGRSATTSDAQIAGDATGSEHVARVNVAGGASVAGVNYGFSFNPVVNTTDDPAGVPGNRTVQGSLRQFLINANAITNASYGVQSAQFEIGAVGSAQTVAPTAALPTITDAVTLNAWTQAAPGYNGVPLIELRGDSAGAGANGFTVDANDSEIRGFVINRFNLAGVWIGGANNLVAGNYLGTDTAGTADLGNSTDGVVLAGPTGGGNAATNTIGGIGTGDRNVISGNNDDGVSMDQSSGNVVIGNYIGLNAAGTAAIGNGGDGIAVQFASANNTVGGTTAAHRNVIAGSGVANLGIRDAGSSNNVVQGNYIGTNFDASAGLTNPGDGVQIALGAQNNTLGGAAAGAGNVIGANTGSGVLLVNDSDNNRIQGNWIGTNSGGANLGNAQYGVFIQGSGSGAAFSPTGTTLGGTAAGAGNAIAYNALDGVGIVLSAASTRIIGNSIHSNGELGIDLVANGVTLNDGFGPYDGDTGPNSVQNFPAFTAAPVTDGGTTLTVSGRLDSTAGASFTIHFYASSVADASGYGEGERYLGSHTVVTNGMGTALFSAIPIPASVAPGEIITMTATNDLQGDTSEFSAGLAAVGLQSIAGRISHDVNGDSNLGGDSGQSGVTVHLFRDGGDGLADGADDTYVGFDVTDAAGDYGFGSLADDTYWVVVDSKTFGANPALWAEQTRGAAGALQGAGFLGAAGALYGGRNATVSDNASAAPASLATAEHVTRVVVSGANVTGVDSAFSYNVVVNVDGDTSDDDGGGTARHSQGTLDQFILNANNIAGANAMRFVPAVAANQASGGDTWWRIGVTSLLPQITGADTTIDGTAYSSADGVTVLDTNTGLIGAGGPVGTGADGVAGNGDDPLLAPVARPELEIRRTSAGALVSGFDVNGANVAISDLAIWGFGNGAGINADIVVRDVLGAVIQGNVVGTGAHDFTDPGAGARGQGFGVWVRDGNGGVAQHNLIGFHNWGGILLEGTGNPVDDWQILGNEIRANGWGNPVFDGIGVNIVGGTTTIQRNLIAANRSSGIDVANAAGTLAIDGNTITGNAAAAGPEQFGVDVRGGTATTTISHNVITANTGSGVVVAGAVAAQITQNSIAGNGGAPGLGIDLSGSASVGDGVTANDLNDADGGPNARQNFPVLAGGSYDGANLTVTGSLDTTAGTFRIEFFASSAADPSGHGEGSRYLGSTTVNQGAAGTMNFTFGPAAVALNAGEVITATATNTATGETSEFSAALYSVTGTVYEDVNGDASLADGVGRAGIDVRLYLDANQNGTPDAGDGTAVATAVTDASGGYWLFAPGVSASLANGQSFVVVDSRDLTPVAGTIAGGADDVWADQTYAYASALGANSVQAVWYNGAYQFQTAAGAFYGGLVADRSDDGGLALNAGAAPAAEHIQRLTIAAGSAGLSGVNSGFSFSAVTNTRGDVADDDGGGTDRLQQGSLRQFILNSNALVGTQTSSFAIAGAGVQTINLPTGLPQITDTIVLDAWSEGVFQGTPGYSGPPLIELNGAGSAAITNGLWLFTGSSGSTIRGFAINRFASDGIGIDFSNNNVIQGNYIGTDAAGTTTAGFGNADDGIDVDNGSSGNTIGGTAASQRNVISGQTGGDGIVLNGSASNNVVIGNYIGTDAGGTLDRGNSQSGVHVRIGATNNTIGGTTAAERNLISGNDLHGVHIHDAGVTGNVVRGNYIGVAADGTTLRGNSGAGVMIQSGASANTIGGTLAGEGNVIGGNLQDGVRIADDSDDNRVQGNWIGTNAGGADLGNARHGVWVEGGALATSSPTLIRIGGIGAGEPNAIAFNDGDGVLVSGGGTAYVLITANSIHSNGELGIDLAGGTEGASGWTANDDAGTWAGANHDPDAGPNKLQNYPSLSGAVWDGATLWLSGTLETTDVVTSYRIHVYASSAADASGHGEGERYLGRFDLANVTGTAAFVNRAIAPLAAVGAGDWITVTATATTGTDPSTSEFSLAMQATSPASVSGTVYEDVNGNGAVLDDGIGRDGVDVLLYRDGGDQAADGVDDVLVASTVTAGGGNYSFGGLANARYWVVVDSRDVTASAGAAVPADVWAEQTFGDDWTTDAVDLAARYGGRNAAASDDATGLATAEHVGRAQVAGGSVAGVNFGFSFSAIVNARGDALDDDGGGGRLHQGSLRQFILNANSIAGTQTSNFSIGGGGAQTIAAAVAGTAALPPITDAVILDATTQEGFNPVTAVPLIQIDGTNFNAPTGLLEINGGAGSTIRGFVLNRSQNDGIRLTTGGNTIAGNYLGTNAAGGAALANAGDGIDVRSAGNTIGGTAAADRNVLSGNGDDGIELYGAGAFNNVVLGNYVGADAAGTAAVANAGSGIHIYGGANTNTIGGAAAGAGNVVSGNQADGITISGVAGNRILGNRIGTNAAGTAALAGNQFSGISITNSANNIIGAAGAGNLISGNDGAGGAGFGISITATVPAAATGNIIQANYVGTDLSGTASIANGSGIYVTNTTANTIGGAGAGEGNLVSGNATGDGIGLIDGGSHVVRGNRVGTDAAGTAALANAARGIFVSNSANNVIGGTGAAGNVVSGNTQAGVYVTGAGATGNVLRGNRIGTDAGGTLSLGNGAGNEGGGVWIGGGATGATIGGTGAGEGNTIANNYGNGVLMTGVTSGLVQGNTITGNFDPSPAPVPNIGAGVAIENASGVTVGGTAAGARNVLSGNQTQGVFIGYNSSGNWVAGNYIGTDAAGTAAQANGHSGVLLFFNADNNTIGGASAAARNIISGNGVGVWIEDSSDANVVSGNYIGVDASGAADLGNSLAGVNVRLNALNNRIGGTAAGEGNVVSGNGAMAVNVDNGAHGTVVQGNYLGTNAAGAAAVQNDGGGVSVGNSANVTIGGAVAGAGNVIAGHATQAGIGVWGAASTGTVILGNLIGRNATDTGALGNYIGISFGAGTSSARVGGTGAGAGNVIAHSTYSGVEIDAAASGIAVLGNSLHSNGALGINLVHAGDPPTGVTANDAGDGDGGANNRQNFPVITTANVSGASITIGGTLDSVDTQTYRIEFFASSAQDPSGHGEGQRYLGFTTVTIAGGATPFSVTLTPAIAVTSGEFVSATATCDLGGGNYGDSSEFGACVVANTAPANTAPATVTATEDTAFLFNGGNQLSVADAEGNLTSVVLTVANGTLTAAGPGTVAGSGTASVTITGTQGDINASLATLGYQGTLNYNGSDTLTVMSTDAGGMSDTDNVAITVNAVNDAPTASAPGSYAATEQTLLDLAGTLTIGDVDAGAGGVTATLSVASGVVNAAAGGTGVVVAGSGTGTVTLSGTLAQINALLAGNLGATLTYFHPTDTPPASDTLTLSVNDNGNTGAGGAQVTSANATINIAAVNDAPSATAPAAYVATEQVVLSLANAALTVSDVDALGLGETVTLSVGSGTLNATAGATGVGIAGMGTNTLTLTGTIAQLNNLLTGGGGSTLTYLINSDTPPATDTLTFSINDGGNSGSGGALVGSANATINITAINDAPVNTVPAVAQTTAEDTALVFSTGNGNRVSIADVDAGAALVDVTLTVTNGTLTLAGTAGLSFTAGANGTATMTVRGTIADLNLAMDGMSYLPALNYNGPATLTITTDDRGNTPAPALNDTDVVNVTVSAANDAPVNTVPPAQATNEDTALVFSAGTGNQVLVADADAGAAAIQVQLTVTNGTLTLAGVAGLAFVGGADGTATMTVRGTAAAINAAMDGMSYAPAADYNGPASLTIATDDLGNSGAGGALADTDVVAITVSAVNDAPVNTVPGAQAGNEDVPLALAGVSVNDVDGGPVEVTLGVANGALSVSLAGGATITAGANGTATLTLAGTQAQVNAALATLAYAGATNWSGADTLTMTTTDRGNFGAGGPLGDLDAIALTISPVNDAPALGANSFTINEGTTLVLGGANLSASDIDDAAGSLVFTVGGVTNGYFQLASSPGVPVSSFTQAQVTSGQVQFVHAGGVPAFTITVSDAAASVGPYAANITFKGGGGTPTPPPGGSGSGGSGGTTVTPPVLPPAAPVVPPGLGSNLFVDFFRGGGGGGGDAGGAAVFAEAAAVVPTVQSASQAQRVAGAVALNPQGRMQSDLIETAGLRPELEVEPLRAELRVLPMRRGLDLAEDDPERQQIEIVMTSVRITGMALSVGAIWWAARAAGLVASLLASSPAWRHVDPLPVLGRDDEGEDEDWEDATAEDQERRDEEHRASWVFEDSKNPS